MKRWLSGALALICILSTGCGQDQALREEVQISDSAGVHWVRFTALERIDAPRLLIALVYRTNPRDLALVGVRDGVFLEDRSLLLANTLGSDLVLIGPSGKTVRTVGRQGEGPGEFKWPAWLEAHDLDVWVYDSALLRLTKLGPDWSVETTRSVNWGRTVVSLQPLSLLSNGALLGVHGENRTFASSGERRDSVPLFRMAPDGRVDTLGVWPGQERAFATISAGRLPIPIGFAPTLFASSRGGAVVIGSSDSLFIERFAPNGIRDLVLQGSSAPVPAGVSAKAAWRKAAVEEIPRSAGEALTREIATVWRDGPVRGTFPAFGGLELDTEGRLWVGAFAGPGDGRRLWVVFDPLGQAVGRVELPTHFTTKPYQPSEVLDIRSGLVAVLRRTELDEEYVEVWRVALN